MRQKHTTQSPRVRINMIQLYVDCTLKGCMGRGAGGPRGLPDVDHRLAEVVALLRHILMDASR